VCQRFCVQRSPSPPASAQTARIVSSRTPCTAISLPLTWPVSCSTGCPHSCCEARASITPDGCGLYRGPSQPSVSSACWKYTPCARIAHTMPNQHPAQVLGKLRLADALEVSSRPNLKGRQNRVRRWVRCCARIPTGLPLYCRDMVPAGDVCADRSRGSYQYANSLLRGLLQLRLPAQGCG